MVDIIGAVLYLGLLVWIGYCIGRIISLRRQSKRLKAATSAAQSYQRGTRGQCYICGDHGCPFPMPREQYYRQVAELTRKVRLRRNRTW